MFEIVENKEIENYEMEYPFLISLNGKIIESIGARESSIFSESGEKGLGYEIESFNAESKFLCTFIIKDFSVASKLSLYGWRYFDDFQINLVIHLNFGYEKYFVDFQIIPDFSFWKKQFSFAEYQELFHEILLEKSSKADFMPSNDKYREFSEILLTISHQFKEKTINEELIEYELTLSSVHEETVLRLLQIISKDDVVATFTFPENLKIPCKQYLEYFAQFLQDLGINTTSDLKEEAGKVLFSVTPTDDVEALDKIREALAVYLKLPESPIVYDDSFAGMRLQQQIENLQHSQKMAVREIQLNEKLLLAQSDVIREKNITISQQQNVIENQSKIIEKISSKSIMTDSLENKEAFEKIFDGLEFGESKELKEKLGIKFNPVTSLKSLGRKLVGKDDEITSLNLDETEKPL